MQKTLKTRFFEKVQVPDTADGCWLWAGATDKKTGYGRIKIDGRAAMAHRVSYELRAGSISDGLHIDHLCRVRNCVNPDHLEPVTSQVNTIRGIGPQLAAERFAAITHCPSGHEKNEQNTYVKKDGSRQCRPCRRDAYAKTKAHNPEKYAAIRARGRAADNARNAAARQ